MLYLHLIIVLGQTATKPVGQIVVAVSHIGITLLQVFIVALTTVSQIVMTLGS